MTFCRYLPLLGVNTAIESNRIECIANANAKARCERGYQAVGKLFEQDFGNWEGGWVHAASWIGMVFRDKTKLPTLTFTIGTISVLVDTKCKINLFKELHFTFIF